MQLFDTLMKFHFFNSDKLFGLGLFFIVLLIIALGDIDSGCFVHKGTVDYFYNKSEQVKKNSVI